MSSSTSPVEAKVKASRSHALLVLPMLGGLTLISAGCYAFVFLGLLRGLLPLIIGVGLLTVVFRAWFRSQTDVDQRDATPTVIETPDLKITTDPRSIHASKELMQMVIEAKRKEPSPPDGPTVRDATPPPALLEDKSPGGSAKPTIDAEKESVDDDAGQEGKVIRMPQGSRSRSKRPR